MKLGCSSWSYHRAILEDRLDQPTWLRICAEELELDGVELVDLHFLDTSREYLREIKKICIDLQLTISCVSASNDFGVADDDARRSEVNRVKHWIDITSFLGAPVLRVFAGWLPREEPTTAAKAGALAGLRRVLSRQASPKRKRWPEMVAALKECADFAGERGVVLGLENHNGRGLVGTAADVERCLKDVGSPWFRLNLDTGDYGDLESIRRTLPHAVHVHAKLFELDSAGTEQLLDWAGVMEILNAGHYRGFLSIEYEGDEDPIAAVPRGARYLRRLLRDTNGGS